MSEHAYSKATCDILEGVVKNFHDVSLTSFIVLYSAIDILSALTRPTSLPNTSRRYFLDWVQKYFIPVSSLPWNAEDIYGARCGIVHTLTDASDLSRNGVARKLQYVRDPALAAKYQTQVDASFAGLIFVPYQELVDSFMGAVKSFHEDVISDPNLRQSVYYHASSLMQAAAMEDLEVK